MAKVSKAEVRIKKIADRIRQLRIDKGYKSYEVFAWDNEIPRVQYWRMEKGANFTIKKLFVILEIHKISLEDFFKGID